MVWSILSLSLFGIEFVCNKFLLIKLNSGKRYIYGTIYIMDGYVKHLLFRRQVLAALSVLLVEYQRGLFSQIVLARLQTVLE